MTEFKSNRFYLKIVFGYFIIHTILGYFITSGFILLENIIRNIDFYSLPEGDFRESIVIEITSFSNLLISLLLIGFLVYFMKDIIIKDFKAFIANIKKNLSLIVSLFLIMLMVSLAINFIISILTEGEIAQNQGIIELMFKSNYKYLILVYVVIFAPFIEELVFRKALYDFVLKKKNYVWAIIISGLVFGLIHMSLDFTDFSYITILLAIPYIVLGLFIGYSYHKGKRNIFIPMGVHLLQNLLSAILILTL